MTSTYGSIPLYGEAHDIESLTPIDDSNSFQIKVTEWLRLKRYNIYEWVSEKRTPILIIVPMIIGIIYYKVSNNWRLSTAVFYTINTLLGELFMIPANKTDSGDLFTVVLYIYGAFFLAGVIGIWVGRMVTAAPEILAQERAKLMEPESPEDVDGDGIVGIWDHIVYWKTRLEVRLDWEEHRFRYMTCGAVLLWLVVGTVYAVVMEKDTIGSAAFFALSTIAAACFVGMCDTLDDFFFATVWAVGYALYLIDILWLSRLVMCRPLL
jgi:hypothetical protein